ncbi:ketosynthase chain-length factor [Micromonospora zhanjiangensis]|uniref:Ketosynthase chain-length factor n=1 Tax=Micromonospora zhanjiangensis TaxID=1522057 RepID=A0ABV8KVG6_9ACTN
MVAATGLTTESYWAAALAGTSGISRLTRFDPDRYPARLAGEVPGFDPAAHLPSRLLPQTDRMTQLALYVAEHALADARLDVAGQPEFGVGVITASSSGGFEFGQRELGKLWSKGGAFVSAYQSFAWFYAVNTGQISIRHQARGPSGVIVTEQAGGLDAIAQARRQLRKGTGQVVTGGVDSSLCPWGWVAQLASGRISVSDDPRRAYLPFDRDAAGHVPGEGGALLILEDAGLAAARGVRPYGRILGYGSTFDPRPGSGRPPALRRAIELALADAGRAAVEIDVVFADAAAVPQLDAEEAEAISAVFGPAAVPVTAPKTMVGRLSSGAAALDVATALLAIRDGVVPPTVHVGELAANLALDLVTDRPRRMPLRTALVLARGYGGFNSALVVGAPADT